MEESPPAVQVAKPMGLARGLVLTARPKQWMKNVLVTAAPGAAGVLFHQSVLARTLGAYGAWCLVASGIYFLNDAIDVRADRRHPRKRLRPVAAGSVPVSLAKTLGVLLVLTGVVVPLAWEASGLALVLAVYGAIQIGYCLGLKDLPIVDLAAVASGFLLRAISGGVSAGVPISHWFLIVASFGSLFMVASKRFAEHVELADDRGAHRASLGEYSLGFLRQVRSVSTSATVLAYCLWAFERTDAVANSPLWNELSIVPFVLALLRYNMLVDAGEGGAPEDVVLADRMLVVLGVVWVVLFTLGVYAH